MERRVSQILARAQDFYWRSTHTTGFSRLLPLPLRRSFASATAHARAKAGPKQTSAAGLGNSVAAGSVVGGPESTPAQTAEDSQIQLARRLQAEDLLKSTTKRLKSPLSMSLLDLARSHNDLMIHRAQSASEDAEVERLTKLRRSIDDQDHSWLDDAQVAPDWRDEPDNPFTQVAKSMGLDLEQSKLAERQQEIELGLAPPSSVAITTTTTTAEVSLPPSDPVEEKRAGFAELERITKEVQRLEQLEMGTHLPSDKLTAEHLRTPEVADLAPTLTSVIDQKQLENVDKAAIQFARSLVIRNAAKQPFDTVSKISKERLKELPLDIDEFFARGFGGVRSRRGYHWYLATVAVKGGAKHALKAWSEMKELGIGLTLPLYTTFVSTLAGKNNRAVESTDQYEIDPEHAKCALDYIKANPVDIAGVTSYPTEVESIEESFEFYNECPPLPPSTNTPRGAPPGFVSVAPQFTTYGAPNTRTRFNPLVELAFHVLEEARAGGLEPDIQLYSSVVQVCAAHRQYERAFAVYVAMKKAGIKPDKIFTLHLVDAFYRGGKYVLAEEVFHALWSLDGVQPDGPMYNHMIRICAATGQVERAFLYYEQLQHFGYQPSLITYTSLIHACVQPRRPEFYLKAFEVFHHCVANGFYPDAKTYNSMLYACCERLDLTNALNIWETISSVHKHAKTIGAFEIILRLIGRTMNQSDHETFGTLHPVDGKQVDRRTRIALAERFHQESVSLGLLHTPDYWSELVGVYTQAAVGIMMFGRKRVQQGDERRHIAVTNEVRVELIQTTWKAIRKLRDEFGDSFKLNERGFAYIMSMYGAADRLEDAFLHYEHMVNILKIKPTMHTFNMLLTWARLNRDLDAGFRVFKEMELHGLHPKPDEVQFFKEKEKSLEKQVVRAPKYPSPYRDGSEEDRFLNTPRLKKHHIKKGIKPMHPLDYYGSFKDY